MVFKIRHAILEITNLPLSKQSAIVINNDIVISSASILQCYLHSSSSFDVEGKDNGNVYQGNKFLYNLQRDLLINMQNSDAKETQHLNELIFQISFDSLQTSKTSSKKQRQSNNLTRCRVKLLYIFNSPDISRNLHEIFSQFNSTEIVHYEVLLSSFLVFRVHQTKSDHQPFENIKCFVDLPERCLRYSEPVHTLDDVLTVCTPFGVDNFYKTITIGKVSNVLGHNGCLFLISNALPTGCEGSAVFNSKLHLIGLIICTAFQRQQENVNLTIVANFSLLIHDFIRQLGLNAISTTLSREPSKFRWHRSIVAIEAAGNQGAGTIVRMQNKTFIITCSHVVFQANGQVSCRSSSSYFKSEIIWRNPHYNRAYDIAILTAPANVPQRDCARLSPIKPSVGMTIYNAGFPHLMSFHLECDFNPSIFTGRIIRYTPGAINSDGCVQAGQSGGPMFDRNGCILGVTVSNIKMDNTVYPNINTAVPISDIRFIIESYAKSDDLAVLNNLVAPVEIQRSWSLDTPIMLSKL